MYCCILAGLAWGIANLGYREEELFARLSVVCVEKMHKMNSTDLFTLIWSFARASRPAEVFISAAYMRLGAGEMRELNAPQLVSLSWAIAKIGTYNPDLMAMLEECITDNLDNFNVKVGYLSGPELITEHHLTPILLSCAVYFLHLGREISCVPSCDSKCAHHI